jgi:hypothetical protein
VAYVLAAPKGTLGTLRIAVPDLVTNSFVPVLAAVDLGFFREEGLDASARALADGHLDGFWANGLAAAGVAVAAAVGAVADGLAGRGRDGGHPAQVGEGPLAAQPPRVVAGGHRQRGGGVGADPLEGQSRGAAAATSGASCASNASTSALRSRYHSASDRSASSNAASGVVGRAPGRGCDDAA